MCSNRVRAIVAFCSGYDGTRSVPATLKPALQSSCDDRGFQSGLGKSSKTSAPLVLLIIPHWDCEQHGANLERPISAQRDAAPSCLKAAVGRKVQVAKERNSD